MTAPEDDASVFGPAQPDAEQWINEGIHYAAACAAIPGIPRTNDPSKVTCPSCLRGLRTKGTI